ncbi:TetR/AcrR family transcriptional regulator [Prescottella agglutinans]|uniref:TetR/AcrR family transcriptional regulator n=1 Tax=Prescottella agglutinans TaxID=1644129 RepID=A0A438BA79_9NOCA|nr:TetR/AcrR family transcriptional regulator [Prescottella agglutinans]RVW07847.1 TetR/AcrR family transcriptional regulator [Prescottella agglutinans]
MASAGRREVILAESARLFSDRGIAATTIREIGDAVGLNSGTLYHYFSSKDAIVSEILVSFLTDLVERYDAVVAEPETARARLGHIVRVSLEVADRHPYATEIYQNEFANLSALPRYTEIAAAVESSHDAWYNVVEDGVRGGEFNSGVDIFEFQRMMRECVFMSVRWHRKTLAQDVDSLTQTLTTVFLNGFVPAPQPGTASPPPTTGRRRAAKKTAATPAQPRGSSKSTDTAESAESSGDIRAELDSLRTELRAIREAIAERPDAG